MDASNHTEMSAGAPWTGALASERQRILAASGWDREPQRRGVLQELLREHCQRIYLHAYAVVRKRAQAVERARHSLLQAARTLSEIPEGCSLSAWIFLDLERAMCSEAECPDAWRVLHKAELEAGVPWLEADRISQGFDAAAFERHLDSHPCCRKMLDAYRRYLALPLELDLPRRAGWDQAREDLDQFLSAQFNPEKPAGLESHRSWKSVFPPVRMRLSRWAGLAILGAAVILGFLFVRAWFDRETQWSENGEIGSRSRMLPVPPPNETPAAMEEPSFEMDGDWLVFRWKPFVGAEGYALRVMTAKLDTLYVSSITTQRGVRVPAETIQGHSPGGHYLYRVDGIREGEVVASTGIIPFRLE